MNKGFQMNHTFPTRGEVMEKIFDRWEFTTKEEVIAVDDALGRVPSKDMYAQFSVPVVRTSALDGIAVHSEAFASGMPDTSTWEYGKDFVRADTGDDFPDAFDAVVRIEFVEIDKDNKVTLTKEMEVKEGTGVRPAGSIVREGQRIARGDRPLRAMDLSTLVMGGVNEVPVYQKPTIAFIPTGNELVAEGCVPSRGQTVNSNSILIKNLLLEMGADPVIYPIVRDNKKELEEVVYRAMEEADLVLINGGSSMGEEDFNARFLEENGEVIVHGVSAGPGQPVCISFFGNKPVFNIPGPPIGLFYVTDWCIKPMVCRMLHIPVPQRRKVEGLLTEDMKTPPKNEKLSKLNLKKNEDGEYEVECLMPGQSTVAENMCSDALYVSELEGSVIKAGEKIEVEMLIGEEYL